MGPRTSTAREHEHGFTIVEVMVAMVILLVGLAGTITLLDEANAKTTTDKAREGAVALSRELVEAARSNPYDQLTPGNVVGAIRGQTGFSASTLSGAGWQVQRRGVLYTMAVGVCSVDDPADGRGAQDPTFCAGDSSTTAAQCATALGGDGSISGAGTASGVTVGECGIDLNRDGQVDNLTRADLNQCTASPCPGGGTADKNPDDYKRVVTLVRWPIGSGSRFVLESTTLPYPGLSAAPRVDALTAVTANPLTDYTVTSFAATATTNRKASSVAWSLDGTPSGTATAANPAATSWSISWPLGAAACATGGTSPASGEVLDGVYVLGAKASDGYGQSGPTKAVTVTLNRCVPYAPSKPLVVRVGSSTIQALWTPNAERDVESYQLFRASGTNTNTACPASKASACTETSPPSSGAWDYYVVASDRDGSGNLRAGRQSPRTPIDFAITPPTAPTGVAGARVTALSARITWTAATGTPGGYQVYRDGTSLSDRYGDVLPATATSFTDTNAMQGHTYYVATTNSDGTTAPVQAESVKSAGVYVP